jgi:hypothetical protein
MNQKELDSWNASNEGIIWQLENNDPAEALDIAIDARKEIITLTTPQPEASDREMAVKIVDLWQCACDHVTGYDRISEYVATIRADERRKAVKAAKSEKVEAVPGSESDEAYNRAIDDACRAILGDS